MYIFILIIIKHIIDIRGNEIIYYLITIYFILFLSPKNLIIQIHFFLNVLFKILFLWIMRRK